MLHLIPFTKNHYQTLINWIIDEEILLKFAGIGFQYPLTQEQLDQYIAKYPDRKLYLALDDQENPVGYGEIIPQEENSARLGHLIIGKSQNRGLGLGQKLIQALNNESKSHLQIKNMDLFVLDGNTPAINCYLKSGFNFIPNNFSISYKDKTYQILKMTIVL
ncbi:GNAT family N-acetyltransferase [Pedobacter cryophilus]|uniref:GNAT family N-acetyltransferase n=1 Tax=Pedobacter cryophilus TaxID=2571271 RepID=A0A4U1C0H4_9SPHI|nr:GNAT family N-acetyltransferase [Pedobacter cryophilus]TKB97570.1 GNAT family N-acetyltransferase [Pedobacter cryophilus]